VAIKILRPEYSKEPKLVARFFNEARAVNIVSHPGIVGSFDYGQLPDGTAYIVMEFLKGESLSKRIERSGGRLPAAEVIQLSLQIADALAAAHAKDVIHRDLKPENVMLVPEPHMPGGERTKLLDFGIAKVMEPGDGDRPRVQTKTTQLMGTPMYMSPEQCEGAGRVDAKTDAYSLGVMMFEMLAGELPFMADGPGKLLGMHMFAPAPLLKEVAPEVPADLAALVQRLLIKEREQRPSMGDVVAELTALTDHHPLPRPADASRSSMQPPVDPLSDTQVAPRSSTPEASASQATTQPARRSRRLVALIFAVGLLLALGSGVLLAEKVPALAALMARVRRAARLVTHHEDPKPAAAPKPPPAPAPKPAAPADPSSTQPKPSAPAAPPAAPPKPSAPPPKPAPPPRPSAPKPKAAKAPVRRNSHSKIVRAVKHKLLRRKKR
jgi:serine/threonine-protein kinase